MLIIKHPKRMKSWLLILSTLLILFIVFQFILTMSTQKTENQSYKVLYKEQDYEIRYYPAVTMATISSSAKSYKELSSSGFKKLASYIFGGNHEKKQISMTSPVHMDINDSNSTMGFVMPTSFSKDQLPLPNDPSIAIKTIKEEYVAAISFGGFASDATLKFYKKKLATSLKKSGAYFFGNFRYLGYNPPYQLLNRKNEIIVSVQWDGRLK